jgi:Ni/Co efflux regulator RcnB
MFSVSEKEGVRLNIMLLVMLWVAVVAGAVAPSQSNKSLTFQMPDNCEGNSRRLDFIRNKSQAMDEGQVTIAIARLGKGERSPEINRRRLYTIRAYLTAMELPSRKLVTAEGERVAEYGRLEVYIGGELVDVLAVERGQDLRVGMCDDDREDRKRYQLPRRRNTHHRR